MNTVKFDHKVGDVVIDDLTGRKVTIIGVSYEDGKKSSSDKRSASHTVGYWVDNDYMGGGRHPWELTNQTKGGVV